MAPYDIARESSSLSCNSNSVFQAGDASGAGGTRLVAAVAYDEAQEGEGEGGGAGKSHSRSKEVEVEVEVTNSSASCVPTLHSAQTYSDETKRLIQPVLQQMDVAHYLQTVVQRLVIEIASVWFDEDHG